MTNGDDDRPLTPGVAVLVDAAPLAEAAGWIESYQRTLERRFERLDAVLVELQSRPPARKSGRRRAPRRRQS